MPAITFSRVDLPVPLPPTRPARSFGVISQSRPSNSSLWPNLFPAPVSCNIYQLFSLSEKKVERIGNIAFQFRALHDRIQETMLQKKLAALKTLGQLLTNGLLNHAWTSKTN